MITSELRQLAVQDLAALTKLDRACHPFPWGKQRLQEELEHAEAVVVGAFVDGELVGYLALRMIVDELWIMNIGVHPEKRGQGIADQLMERAVTTSSAASLPLWLEVRESNTVARKLYERHGMLVVGRRPGYYGPLPGATTREAAVLMKREVVR